MKNSKRSNLVSGLILMLFGGAWLVLQFIPGLQSLFQFFSWPMIILAVGLLMLILGLLLGSPQMAIPASIIAGIGCILFWQNATGKWDSWIYAWTLIPGFIGVGQILASLAGGGSNQSIRKAFRQIIISAILFLIMGSLLGGFNVFGPYWPLLLIIAGLYLIIEPWITARLN